MSMEDAIVTAASAVVVAFLVTVAFIMGFRKRLRLDEAALARELAVAEPGARLEAVAIAPDGGAALATLADGKLLVARVMADGVALRAAPLSGARVTLRAGQARVRFADIGFPPLRLRVASPAPAWLRDLAGETT